VAAEARDAIFGPVLNAAWTLPPVPHLLRCYYTLGRWTTIGNA